MKNTLIIPACVAIVCGLTGSLALSADSASEIAKQFESQKADALEKYLADNPDAEDTNDAVDLLIGALMFLEQPERLIPLLEKRYDSMEKGASANLEILIGQTARPLIESYRKAGEKTKAIAFIEQAKKDLAKNPAAPQINQFFDGLLGQMNQPGVGDKMEIAFTATDGTEVDLAKMGDKVVLVDFWATWCGPCIAELPHVLDAYEKYKDKGFEVIGISLDSDKAKFEEFVKGKVGMTWPQQFDGKGWENEIAGKFGINSIPATFLVGKDGKVVASNLRGSQLEEKLKELLD